MDCDKGVNDFLVAPILEQLFIKLLAITTLMPSIIIIFNE